MDMTGEYRIPAPRQRVWEALNDPEVLKAAIPGCDELVKKSDTELEAKVTAKVGPVSAKFGGAVTLGDLNPPESYTIAFDGSGGVAGFGKGSAQVKLVPLPPADAAGQESCELHYTVHATVGGKIAQLGQRLIDGAAKSMAEDFFERFDEEMQRRYPRPEAAAAVQGMAEPAEGGLQSATAAASGGPSALAASAEGQIPDSGVPVWVWVLGALHG